MDITLRKCASQTSSSGCRSASGSLSGVRFLAEDSAFSLDCSEDPEFSCYRWVDLWYPAENVITFKRGVYRKALSLFELLV